MGKVVKDYRDAEIERAREWAAKNTAEHVIQQLHADGDRIRQWRFGKPGSSTYVMYILCVPGRMIVWGDMEEYMWSRTDDMLEFMRRNLCHGGTIDRRYVTEKMPRAMREYVSGYHEALLQEYLRDLPAEYQESHGERWDKNIESMFREMKDSLAGVQTRDEAISIIYHSDFLQATGWDAHDLPSLRCYSYQYLWTLEALRLFINQLDASGASRGDVAGA